jgi:hypothetical protein
MPLRPAAEPFAQKPPGNSSRSIGSDPAALNEKPLLMVDIDGVISLFGFDHRQPPPGAFHSIDGIPHYLSANAAEHLLALDGLFDLVWCSGWEEKANEYLPRLLGLPEPLPYLSFHRGSGAGQSMKAHWKLDAIDAFARRRPLAWIDDAFNEACEEWATRRTSPTLLLRTEPQLGLTAVELERLLRWSAEFSTRV